MFPVLALGGQRGRAELAEELDHLAVLLDVLLRGGVSGDLVTSGEGLTLK